MALPMKFTVFARFPSNSFKCYGAKQYSNMTTLKESHNVFTLTLKGAREDYFLSPRLLESFSTKLDEVKSNATNGSVLITTAEGGYFCRGFSRDEYHEVIDPFRQLLKDLMSLPMPTIAAINGAAINAGLILAMSHDHLIMEPSNPVLSMMEKNSIKILPKYFEVMIRSKAVPEAFSRLALSTVPFNFAEAKKMGLAVQHPNRPKQKPLNAAIDFALMHLSDKNRDGNKYVEGRKTMYPELCKVLGLSSEPSSRR